MLWFIQQPILDSMDTIWFDLGTLCTVVCHCFGYFCHTGNKDWKSLEIEVMGPKAVVCCGCPILFLMDTILFDLGSQMNIM